MADYSEVPPTTEDGAENGVPPSFPPYPPYAVEPAPASVADTVFAGNDVRRNKYVVKKPAKAPPRPAKARYPKATDVKLPRQAMRSHARCLKRHGTVLTDRLERISKPSRRNIIQLWREFAGVLPPETISRLRSMLNADEPFKPDQAYEYFVNLRKTRKKAAQQANSTKKNILCMYSDKRFVWARNATVAFAKGIQVRLSRPGCYELADRMLRLSNIILDDICKYMHMRTPSRCCNSNKAKFMIEMADKIVVWIDEILCESDDRMLMMDFDEDEDVVGLGDMFASDFLDMMSDDGGDKSGGSKNRVAVKAVLDMMKSKPKNVFAKRPSYAMDYGAGASEIEAAPSLTPYHPIKDIVDEGKANLTRDMEGLFPPEQESAIKSAISDIAEYLSQPFGLRSGIAGEKYPQELLTSMKASLGDKPLYKHKSFGQTFEDAADTLSKAGPLDVTSGPDTQELKNDIKSKIKKAVAEKMAPSLGTELQGKYEYVPDTIDDDMTQCDSQESLDMADSQRWDSMAVNIGDKETTTERDTQTTSSSFSSSSTQTNFTAIDEEKNTLANNAFGALVGHELDVIDVAATHLANHGKGKGGAVEHLVTSMKEKGDEPLAPVQGRMQTYSQAANKIQSAPSLKSDVVDKGTYGAVKDKLIALSKDKTGLTEQEAKQMPEAIDDVSKFLAKTTPASAAAGGGPGAAGSDRRPGETDEQYQARLAKEALAKRPGETEEQYQARLAKERLARRPGETEEQYQARLAKEALAKRPGETEEQYQARLAKERLARRPGETEEQYQARLAKEGLGKRPGETEEEYQARLAKERLARRPGETEEQYQARLAKEALAKRPGETEEEYQARLAKERLARRPGETEEQYQARLAKEGLGKRPGETEEQYQARLAKERLARRPGETEEQYQARLAKEGLGKRPGETEEEYQARLAKERLAKRPGETEDEYQARLAKERLAKRPGETEEEYQARLAKERLARRPGETEEQYQARLAKEALAKRPGETEEEYQARLAKERLAKRPGETEEQYQARLAREALAKRPGETEEEYQARLAKERLAKRPGETEEEYQARLAKERLARRPGETEEQYQARLAKEGLGKRPGETEEQYQARLAKERLARRPGETEEQYQARLAKEGLGKRPGETEEQYQARLAREAAEKAGRQRQEADHKTAVEILHKQMRGHGNETFYEQPNLSLTHQGALDWLNNPPLKVDKSVKESGDTSRLHNKFEKKLDALVGPVTPPNLVDAMQDVIIENARQLSEQFVASSYKAQAGNILIKEMQKHGNEILAEVEGAAETSFFAAQRLKREKDLTATEPCIKEAPGLIKKLDEITRTGQMPRKLASTLKEHNKEAGNFLSTQVTKPDPEIEAHVALLQEMEATGDALLAEGEIPKSHKDAAAYLRQLTSHEDKINRPNRSLQNSIEGNLKKLMNDVPHPGYSNAVKDKVIKHDSQLLTSYLTHQAEKTAALKHLVKNMEENKTGLLLRHGNMSKYLSDGVELLRDKNTDQLGVTNADPVVMRKIELKLNNLMNDKTPNQFAPVMNDVINDATMYLAVRLLEPQVIKVCKCMKDVFVQCELWCDEILRRIAKPSCKCSRHVSVQDLHELKTEHLKVCPDSAQIIVPGVEVALKECETKYNRPCQAPFPSPICRNVTASYIIHAIDTSYGAEQPSRLIPGEQSSPDFSSLSTLKTPSDNTPDNVKLYSGISSPIKSLLQEIHSQNMQFLQKYEQNKCLEIKEDTMGAEAHSTSSGYVPQTTLGPCSNSTHSYNQLSAPICSKIRTRDSGSSLFSRQTDLTQSNPATSQIRTPISTEQMADWHAMMISLIWNVQAWRKWIQGNIDQGLSYQYLPKEESKVSSWAAFERRISTEALQWRQYTIFSHQLIMQLLKRYNDKEILSGATVKTEHYHECANEMLDIIHVFNSWTQWLILVVRETGSLHKESNSSISLNAMRWIHYKNQMDRYSKDWIRYNLLLKLSWEKKYEIFISECMRYISDSRPVWVVGACGAVPSGAVAAGVYDGETIWVARTTHRSKVLPAALHPSKHCCTVFSEGSVHYCTKYQVMCNAEVNWVPWRGGSVRARAVRVAEGVYVGRVHYRGSHLVGPVYTPLYRCHVVIFGRRFAFNCYDLLVLSDQPPPVNGPIWTSFRV